MTRRMLIDGAHPEEVRVVITEGNKLLDYDVESSTKTQNKGNIYLAKVMRVEPSLQAAFVDYGGNRHGFLAFSEIHPDYYQIPIEDREALKQHAAEFEEAALAAKEHLEDLDGDSDMDDDVDDDEDDIEEEEEEETAEDDDDVEASGEEDGDGEEDQEADESLDDDESDDDDSDDGKTKAADSKVESVSGEVTGDEEKESGSDENENNENQDEVEAAGEASDTESESDGEEDSVEARGAEDVSEEEEEETSDADDKDADEDGNAEAASDDDGDQAGDDQEDDNGSGNRRRRGRGRRKRGGGRPFQARGYKIQEVIKRNQIILVQVVKEERGNKGAALTTYLSLAGRYCVLMPNVTRGSGGVSRKITSATDRRKLRDTLKSLDVPEGMGVIMRTAGMQRNKSEIKRDFDYLMRVWEDVRERTLESSAPDAVYEEGDLVKRAIRDLYTREVEEVWVEGADTYQAAKKMMRLMMPSHAKRVQPYKDDTMPMFHRYQVENQIEAMHDPTVQLKSGGYLVINPTEALVAIDVNSGRATRERNIEETATKTNLEAATEIAHQLKLRDLAGLIVIDFIDMDERGNQRAVEKRFKDAVKTDRARIQVGRISNFGLLELSRQRMRPSFVENSTQICQHCSGTGVIRSTESLTLQALRLIEEEGTRERSSEVTITMSTQVALYLLNEKRDTLETLEARYGFKIRVVGDDSISPTEVTLDRVKGQVSGQQNEAAEKTSSSDSDDDSKDDNEGGRKRRPRRRRRKNQNNDADGSGTETETESEQAADASENTDSDDDNENDDDRPRRRRRGRRGGRRRNQRGGRGRRQQNADGEGESETAADSSGNDDGDSGKGSDTNASEEKKPDNDTTMQASQKDESASARNGDDSSSAPEPAEIEKPEPAAAQASSSDEPPKKGWWQKILD